MHRIGLALLVVACHRAAAPPPSNYVAALPPAKISGFRVDTKWSLRCSDGPIECSVYNSAAVGFDVECATSDGHRALSFGFQTTKTEYTNEDSLGCVDHTTRVISDDAWCIEHTFISRQQWEANRDAARRRGAIVDNLGSYSEYRCPGGSVEVLCMSAAHGLVSYRTRSVNYEWQCGRLPSSAGSRE